MAHHYLSISDEVAVDDDVVLHLSPARGRSSASMQLTTRHPVKPVVEMSGHVRGGSRITGKLTVLRPPRDLTGEETGIVAMAAQLAALFVTMNLDAAGSEAVAVAVLTYVALRAVLRRVPPLL